MESIFGISLDTYLIAVGTMAVLIVLILLYIAIRNPLLVRLGARNFTRRKSQTVLILIGLMLSTLIISAALVTGDTVGQSITNRIYTSLGSIDIIVGPDEEKIEGIRSIKASDLSIIREELREDLRVDGVAAVLQVDVPAANQQARLSDPRAYLIGVIPDEIRKFKQLELSDGEVLDPGILNSGGVVVSERLAESINLSAGDAVTLFVENTPHQFLVAAIVRDNGLTAKDQAGPESKPGGGVMMLLEDALTLSGWEGPNILVISTSGGVRNDLEIVDTISGEVEALIESSNLSVEVIENKKDLVAIGSLVGSVFVSFFIIFGLFSIAAGLMLIFLTFVMLAAERRSEMGMARAVGMKRLHLTQAFIAEGMLYNVGSALVGAALGVLVAWLMITLLGFIFASFGTEITLNVNPRALALAYLVGIVLTFVTVAFSSWRAANLNIVRSIRDIPEPDLLQRDLGGFRELLRSTWSVACRVIWLVIGFALTISLVGFVISAVQLFSIFGGQIGAAIGVTLGLSGVILIVYFVRKLFDYAHGKISLVRLISRPIDKLNAWSNTHRSGAGWAVWMIILGSLGVYLGGWGANAVVPSWIGPQLWSYTTGTTLIIFSLGILAVYFGAPPRLSFTSVGLIAVWLWLLPLPFTIFPGFPETANGWDDPIQGIFSLFGLGHEPIEGNFEMFFVSGVAVTASSIFVVVYNATLLLAPLNLVRNVFKGVMPAVRIAIAYPLASRFRTAMTLAMFTLVVFGLVVLSILNHNFSQVFAGEEAQAGFDIAIEGNSSNRIKGIDLALTNSEFMDKKLLGEGITSISSLRSATGFLTGIDGTDTRDGLYSVQGMDQSFISTNELKLLTRAKGYDSDEAVFAALAASSRYAIIDESRLKDGSNVFGEPLSENSFRIERTLADIDSSGWEPVAVAVMDPFTGLEQEFEIIGFISSTSTQIRREWSALFVSEQSVDDVFSGGYKDMFYVVATENTDVIELANAIESGLLEQGVQAVSIRKEVDESASQNAAFSALFEGFTALGLIVGIAALGVISFRTVAERRQQIGMLRAIGFRSRLIGLSFFLESSFIAITGILLGLGLGYAISYNILTSPEFAAAGLESNFDVPWLRILVFIGAAYLASSLMTLIPARAASKVPVAEALRYSG
jgi:ABC-type lipoprotein release transport system permease subunit